MGVLKSTRSGGTGRGGRPEPGVLLQVIGYLAWLVECGVALGAFYFWWMALQDAYVAARLDQFGYALLSDSLLVVFGLAWLILVIVRERTYRLAVRDGRLRQRFVRDLGVTLALLLIALVLIWILARLVA